MRSDQLSIKAFTGTSQVTLAMLSFKQMKTEKTTGSGRERAYYGTLRRISMIHRKIATHTYPTAEDLSKEMEVTSRTIKRDLSFMKNSLNAPIAYSRCKRGYYYTQSEWTLPVTRMTEGEILAFFIAEHALRLTGKTPEALMLKRALGKLASLMPEEVSINLAAIGDHLSFQNQAIVPADPKILQRLTLSSVYQTTVRFDYYSPHRREHSRRKADVHLLHNFAGDWYAVSYDHDRADFRDFHVGRIKNLAETNTTFKKQDGWKAEDYLNRGFSMMRGGNLTTVKILFDSYQAQWIREREAFHRGEHREELPDGSLRLSFKIGQNGLEAVARFCLTYAGNCIAESPTKLLEIIRQKLKESIIQYNIKAE
jgi:proteasome accessory factor B